MSQIRERWPPQGIAGRQIQSGTLANRPVAGNADDYYWATDVLILYRYTGTAWEVAARGGTEALTFWRTGNYYISYGLPRLNLNRAINGNFIYATNYPVPITATFDRIAISIQQLEAGKFARLGIYEDNNGYPGALVVDGGTVSVGATGLRTVTINQQLTRGKYWIAVLSDATGTARMYYASVGGWLALGHLTAIGNQAQNASIAVAQAYGALPDPCTGGGAYTTEVYALGLRLASTP